MTIDLSGREVFIASPGNLAEERTACRRTISAFNEEHANAEGVHFLARAWEQLPGGLGRPQARINPLLDKCDFMILMLGDRWGSEPSVDGPYSSGTEEEFHRCIELLASPHAHMRDLLVLFKTVDADKLGDAGPQLRQVMSFRDGLERAKVLAYEQFDSTERLSSLITRTLRAWAIQPLNERTPQVIELPPQMLPDEPIASSTPQLLEIARKHSSDGLLMQAEAAYSIAVKDDDPQAVTEFALFMRRTGRPHQALKLNKQLLKNPILLSQTSSESFSLRANSLANMGIIYRKRGAMNKSRKSLREAVETARSSPEPVTNELCYALDNLGLTLLKNASAPEANAAFEESHSLRKEYNLRSGLAQSAINLGRSHMHLLQFSDAADRFAEARAILATEEDDHLLANALAGIAEARLRQDITDGVEEIVSEAMGINARIQNSDGSSIANSLYARLSLATGALDEAELYARSTREESEGSDNPTGLGTAAWLLAEICLARGEVLRAKKFSTEAKAHAQKAQSNLLDIDIEKTTKTIAETSSGLAGPVTESPIL